MHEIVNLGQTDDGFGAPYLSVVLDLLRFIIQKNWVSFHSVGE